MEMEVLPKKSIFTLNPRFWFWSTIVLFFIKLAYLLPMLALILYANFCCPNYDAGISAASMMFAISRPAVLIIEVIILIVGPFVAWISFLKNRENRSLKILSAIIGTLFLILLAGIITFLVMI